MTDAHPAGRCWCPVCTAAAGLLLLDRGRPDMASRLMRGLPDAIGEALDEVYARGLDAGRKAAAKAKPARPEPPSGGSARPAFKHQAAELIEHVDRLGLTKAAELLGVRPGDMAGLLAGTVQAPGSGMERLRKAAANDIQF